MAQKENNVPKLRFPEFIADWKYLPLKNSFPSIRNGFVGTATPYYKDGIIPYLQGKNIKKGQIDPTGLIKVSSFFHEWQSKSQLKINDILMVQSGHVGECAKVTEEYNNANCHALIIMSPNDDVSSDFYVLYFYSPMGKQQIEKIKTGNTVEHILTSDLKPLKIAAPVLMEQKKIAAFLGAVDVKIGQLQKKKDLLDQYKKSCMQKLFSQQIRFTDDNGKPFPDWEEKKLGDVLDYEQPTKYLVSSTEYSDQHKIPVLTAGKTFILGYTDEDYGIYQNLPVIIFDDFTTAFHYVDFPFKAKSSAMKMLTTKNTKDSLKYFHGAMTQIEFTLGEHKRYWISEYQNEKINYPHPDEQQKIADFLTAIDDKIALVTTQLDKAKTFKKGLLQQMFL